MIAPEDSDALVLAQDPSDFIGDHLPVEPCVPLAATLWRGEDAVDQSNALIHPWGQISG